MQIIIGNVTYHIKKGTRKEGTLMFFKQLSCSVACVAPFLCRLSHGFLPELAQPCPANVAVPVSSVAYDLSALSADLQQHRAALAASGISAPLAALHISGRSSPSPIEVLDAVDGYGSSS